MIQAAATQYIGVWVLILLFSIHTFLFLFVVSVCVDCYAPYCFVRRDCSIFLHSSM